MIQAISFGSIKTFRHKKAWTDAPEIIQAAAFIVEKSRLHSLTLKKRRTKSAGL
jgi:hypothetical protein